MECCGKTLPTFASCHIDISSPDDSFCYSSTDNICLETESIPTHQSPAAWVQDTDSWTLQRDRMFQIKHIFVIES